MEVRLLECVAGEATKENSCHQVSSSGIRKRLPQAGQFLSARDESRAKTEKSCGSPYNKRSSGVVPYWKIEVHVQIVQTYWLSTSAYHLDTNMGKKSKSSAKAAAESKSDDTPKSSDAAGLPFLASTAAVDPSLASLFEKSVCNYRECVLMC